MFQETARKHWRFNYREREKKKSLKSQKSRFKRIESQFGKHVSRRLKVGWSKFCSSESFFFPNRHDCQQWVQLISIFLFFSFTGHILENVWEGGGFLTGVEKGCTGPTGNPGKLERKLRVRWVGRKTYKMLWLSSEVSESEFRRVVLMLKVLASCIHTQSGGVKESIGAFHLPGMVWIWVKCKMCGSIVSVSQ